jgi:hypothetical protein
MPFRSQAQRRFLYAVHPRLAERFARETPAGAQLPEHAAGSRRRQRHWMHRPLKRGG